MTMVKGCRGVRNTPLAGKPPKIAVAFAQVNTQLILNIRRAGCGKGCTPYTPTPLNGPSSRRTLTTHQTRAFLAAALTPTTTSPQETR